MRLVAVLVLTVTTVAHAAPPEPHGAHPRMLLDDELRATWKAQARDARGPVVGAINLCTSGQTQDHDRGLYQGSEWARVLQACLVAWAATERPEHATTAIKFMNALLDDRDTIGDRQGGDTAARRDSGYAIRNHGPYTALAYDWLHDVPQMTPRLRHKARQRWKAWLSWYRDKGYRARAPGTNYQAAYLAAATMIAVAQGGEAAEERGGELWTFVADELWGKDMAAALGAGGILDGGDWPEGWQYGPLAVAHYALAARIARAHGIEIAGVARWLASVLRRHVYGLSPDDEVYVGQDTEHPRPNIAPHVLTLNAIALGDASPEDRRWARGELARLKLVDKDFFLFDALANTGGAALAPRASWPTWYTAPATGTVFARTRWDERAVWFVTECQRGLPVDHRHPKAGNFVLSRGTDDVIVDPSPYGAASTLTSNAPTVASAHFPDDYIPSQALWSEDVGWVWTTQTRSGVVAARCDYADAYRFQHRKSDVPEAIRDVVLLPGTDGTEAVLVVADRARTGSPGRGMHLQFRVPGGLALDGDTATKTIGTTQLAITSLARTAGRPAIGRTRAKDCFQREIAKGQCDAARFEVSDFRLEVPGPAPRAVHAISITAAGSKPARTTRLAGEGVAGVTVEGPRDAVVVWPTRRSGTLRYRAPPGTHVILDAPQLAGMATITAVRDGDACAVTVTPGGMTPARPAIVTVDASCAVTLDPASTSAASAIGTRAPTVVRARSPSPRTGCCAAQATPGSAIAMALVVLAVVLRRRVKGRERARCAR